MADEDPELPEYPGHSAAYGRILRLALPSAQGLSRAEEHGVVADLAKVRDDELVLLSQLRAQTSVPIWPDVIPAEIARRHIGATAESVQAIHELQTSIDTLHLTTQAASVTTREAIGELKTSIHDLRVSADTWSRRLTLLTVGLFALTVGLLAAAIGQVWR